MSDLITKLLHYINNAIAELEFSTPEMNAPGSVPPDVANLLERIQKNLD